MYAQLTNLKHEVKAKLEADYQYGGQRSPTQVPLSFGMTIHSCTSVLTSVCTVQVLANSLGGTVFAIAAALQVLDVPFIRSVPAAALQGAFLVSLCTSVIGSPSMSMDQ